MRRQFRATCHRLAAGIVAAGIVAVAMAAMVVGAPAGAQKAESRETAAQAAQSEGATPSAEPAPAKETVKKPSRAPEENQREPRQKVKAGASVAFPVDI